MPKVIVTTAAKLPAEIAKRIAADVQLARRAALDAALRGVQVAVAATNKAGAVDQGLFKLSWGARPTKRGAALENTAPYAGVIERGRRPGRPGPPLQPIIDWVHRKHRTSVALEVKAIRSLALGLARAGGRTRRERAERVRATRKGLGRYENAVNAAVIARAMAIRDAIHARGTKPRFILRGSLPQVRRFFITAVMRQLRRR